MTTSSCCSSNGRSSGPCKQTTSSTDQPSPTANRLTAIFAKSRSPAMTYNLYHERRSTPMAATVERQMGFPAVLAAPDRSPDIPESADVYGWLCGSWDLEVLHYRAIDVSGRGMKGEVHA